MKLKRCAYCIVIILLVISFAALLAACGNDIDNSTKGKELNKSDYGMTYTDDAVIFSDTVVRGDGIYSVKFVEDTKNFLYEVTRENGIIKFANAVKINKDTRQVQNFIYKKYIADDMVKTYDNVEDYLKKEYVNIELDGEYVYKNFLPREIIKGEVYLDVVAKMLLVKDDIKNGPKKAVFTTTLSKLNNIVTSDVKYDAEILINSSKSSIAEKFEEVVTFYSDNSQTMIKITPEMLEDVDTLTNGNKTLNINYAENKKLKANILVVNKIDPDVDDYIYDLFVAKKTSWAEFLMQNKEFLAQGQEEPEGYSSEQEGLIMVKAKASNGKFYKFTIEIFDPAFIKNFKLNCRLDKNAMNIVKNEYYFLPKDAVLKAEILLIQTDGIVKLLSINDVYVKNYVEGTPHMTDFLFFEYEKLLSSKLLYYIYSEEQKALVADVILEDSNGKELDHIPFHEDGSFDLKNLKLKLLKMDNSVEEIAVSQNMIVKETVLGKTEYYLKYINKSFTYMLPCSLNGNEIILEE